MHRRAWSAVLDHRGLVAGMFDALGIGDELDRALRHNPETRIVTVGRAVTAMVLNGLGLVHQQLYLVPMFFQNEPTQRLMQRRPALWPERHRAPPATAYHRWDHVPRGR